MRRVWDPARTSFLVKVAKSFKRVRKLWTGDPCSTCFSVASSNSFLLRLRSSANKGLRQAINLANPTLLSTMEPIDPVYGGTNSVFDAAVANSTKP